VNAVTPRTIVKRKKSLRENGLLLVPSLYDIFVAQQDTLLEHPRKIDGLHAMRLSGKPLRYVMEVYASVFGRQFAECLEEIKLLLDELGRVHDSDVLIVKLRDHLLQVQMLNRVVRERSERYALKPVQTVIANVRLDRARFYAQACTRVRRWKRTRFRTRLVRSMLNTRRSTGRVSRKIRTRGPKQKRR